MSSNLIRWGGPALMLGGFLWILNYVVQIVLGVTLGAEAYSQADPSTSALVWLWGVFFMGAVLSLGVGLLGVRARLEGRSKILGIVGGLLASVAIVTVSINLVMLAGVSGEPTASDGLGFLGVIGTLGGAILLGIATLGAKVLPRWARVVLTLTPFAFIPAIIATFPLESVLPEYVASDLPFPVVGAVFATVGYAMLRDRRSEADKGNGGGVEAERPGEGRPGKEEVGLMRRMLKVLTVSATMAAMLAVSAMPATTLEYGGGSENGYPYGYFSTDGLYADGITNTEFGYSAGRLYTDGASMAGLTSQSGYSAGYFSTDGLHAEGLTETAYGSPGGIVYIGDVCFGTCASVPH